MIKINNLLKIYNKNKIHQIRAIDDMTLSLPEKGLVAIFGKSGSGKTTLMNALGGLDKFNGGEIVADGNVYKHSVEDKYRIENIGYIFQNYLLDEGLNVYENVAQGIKVLGIKDENIIFDRVMTALENVGMRKYYKRKINTLSGGQQQRVAIARAIVKGAKIILADEPTGNLDEINTKNIMEILKALSENSLVVVVTHEADLIEKYADSVIEIKDGKIESISDGTKLFDDNSDKTKIFLKDKDKRSIDIGQISIDYYGEEMPMYLQIVNENGKIYVATNFKDIKLLQNNDEVKFVDKTKEEYLSEKKQKTSLAIEKLGALKSKKAGRVFDFKESFKRGVRDTLGKTKKRFSFFSIIITMAVVVLLFVIGGFGKNLYLYENAGSEYNPEVLKIINVENASSVEEIKSLAKEKGYEYEHSYLQYRAMSFNVKIGGFESFSKSSTIYFDMPLNGTDVAKNQEWIVGDKSKLDDINYIAISKGFADKIINAYKIDIGLEGIGYDIIFNTAITYSGDNNNLKIAGIVNEQESYVYMDLALCYQSVFDISLDTRCGVEAKDGEIIVSDDEKIPNDILTIYGKVYNVVYSDKVQDKALNRKELLALADRFEGGRMLIFITDEAEEFRKCLIEEGYSDIETKSTYVKRQKQLLMNYEMKQSTIYLGIISTIIFIEVFIMFYAVLASKIKEIGLMRAIGVSKKNILFRYFVESLAVVAICVLPVYIVIGLPIVLFSMGKLLYIQWWLYLLSFLLTSGVVVLAGILPVAIYVQKSPVKILSKYDL